MAIVEHLNLLEPNDIAARLDELRTLPDGWLDGKGIAPQPGALDWLATSFAVHYPENLPLPYLYPTAEGGIQAEWSLNDHEITLDIDLNTQRGDWHALQMITGKESTESIDLGKPPGWLWLSTEIQRLSGESA